MAPSTLYTRASGRDLHPLSPAHQTMSPAAQAFFLLLKDNTLVSFSVLLYLLLLLVMFVSTICHSGLNSKVTSSKRPPLTTLTKAPTMAHSPSHSLIFIVTVLTSN